MKKIIRNSRLIAVAFITFFSTTAIHAGDSSGIRSTVPAELRYAGMVNNDPLFILEVAGNSQHDDFIIRISDKHGNNLYRENIKAENFSKKFLLNTEELGDETLLFEIISRKSNKTVVYEVSSKGRFVNETTVSMVR
jgi:hypothetical protein